MDKGTNKKQSITISATNKLSKEEIEKMKKQAAEFAEEDKKKKEMAETVNAAETLAYTVEKTVNEAGDKVDKDSKDKILEKVKAIREAINAKDLDKIKQLQEELSKEIQDIGSKLYQTEPQAEGPQGTNPGSPGPQYSARSETVDAQTGNQGEGQGAEGQNDTVVDGDAQNK